MDMVQALNDLLESEEFIELRSEMPVAAGEQTRIVLNCKCDVSVISAWFYFHGCDAVFVRYYCSCVWTCSAESVGACSSSMYGRCPALLLLHPLVARYVLTLLPLLLSTATTPGADAVSSYNALQMLATAPAPSTPKPDLTMLFNEDPESSAANGAAEGRSASLASQSSGALYQLKFFWKVELELRAIYDIMLDEQKESLHDRVVSNCLLCVCFGYAVRMRWRLRAETTRWW
jgi:hypothetical protein